MLTNWLTKNSVNPALIDDTLFGVRRYVLFTLLMVSIILSRLFLLWKGLNSIRPLSMEVQKKNACQL